MPQPGSGLAAIRADCFVKNTLLIHKIIIHYTLNSNVFGLVVLIIVGEMCFQLSAIATIGKSEKHGNRLMCFGCDVITKFNLTGKENKT